MDPAPVSLVVVWLLLHIGALAAAWCARIAVGSRAEAPLQLTCFAAMAAVGTAAWICRDYENGLSIFSGIVLVAMVLSAVTDFRRTHEVHPVLYSATNS